MKLEEYYLKEQYPTTAEIQSLAAELGDVKDQAVKTWFRNRRKGAFPMNKNNRKNVYSSKDQRKTKDLSGIFYIFNILEDKVCYFLFEKIEVYKNARVRKYSR